MHETSPNLTRDTILRWRTKPEIFCHDLFGVDLDSWQQEGFDALADPAGGRITIRACHGPGKTMFDAMAIYWFLFTHFPTRIPCTAPTSHQLSDILWTELHKWHRRMHPAFKDFVSPSAEKLEWTAAPRESFAVARTARPEKPEALQGFHCENVLFVIDEASGVAESIFEVAEGALTEPGAKVIMTANPTRASGYFYEAHHRMRHLWHTIKVGASDSPRVSDEYVENMAMKYGRDSNVFRVRVLGEFPKSDDDAVISLELAESAKARDVHPWGDWCWGLDVAFAPTGDRNALCKRHNNVVPEPIQSWRGMDTMQTVGRVMKEWDDTDPLDRPTAIYVDVIGIGAGVVHRLRELNMPVVGVNVAESASVREGFARQRSELWWECREWLEGLDVRLPDDDELIGELVTPKYKELSSGKILVEPKSETKKRLGSGAQSPDLADSLILTFKHRFEHASRKQHAISYTRRELRRKSMENTDWVV